MCCRIYESRFVSAAVFFSPEGGKAGFIKVIKFFCILWTNSAIFSKIGLLKTLIQEILIHEKNRKFF